MQTIRAEAILCEIITDNNLSLSTADTLSKTLKIMFPDSKIAAGLKCARNKATAMITDIASIVQDEMGSQMSDGPFTVSTDGSNDDSSKLFPMVVRLINPTTGLVESELLSIPVCDGAATGENIFKLMDDEMSSRKVPWTNCLAIGCDNANVMTGHKKGVFAFAKESHPNIYLAGCTLHLIHIAARHGAKCLPNVDELLVDIHYFFNKSDKRKKEFRGTQDMYSQDRKKMLKHVCKRWLSIGRCLERLLHNWDALKVYFKGQKDGKENKKPAEKKSSSKAVEVAPATAYLEPTYAERKIDNI